MNSTSKLVIEVSFSPETMAFLMKVLKPCCVTDLDGPNVEPSSTPEPVETYDVASLPMRALFLIFDSRPPYKLSFLLLVSSKLVRGRLRSAGRFFYPQHPHRGFERIEGDGHWREAFEDKKLFKHAVGLRLPARINFENTFRTGFENNIWEDVQAQINELIEHGGWKFPMATPNNYSKKPGSSSWRRIE